MRPCRGKPFHRWTYSERGGVRSWWCRDCETLHRAPLRKVDEIRAPRLELVHPPKPEELVR